MPQRYDPIHDILIDDEQKSSEATANKEEPQEDTARTTAESKEDDVKSETTEAAKDDEPEFNELSKESELKNEDTDAETLPDAPPSEAADPSPTASIPPPSNTTTEGLDTPTPKKHKLSPSPSKIPLKKIKKSGNKSATVLSSARSRHLKKDDGRPFLRKDIQYQFLKDLFENETRAFTDLYADSKDKVITEPDTKPHKLTFAELYIKTIAHSSKCSKILRDRLLNDMKMSIPTSMICLLVNVGRMNTTINFVPDMKSQLRTYHSIPCLQVNYDASENKFTNNGNGGDKQLQDTPRLKSILKACCDDTDEPNALNLLEEVKKLPKTSVINVIFLLCNAEDSINKKYLDGAEYTFFDIFMNSEYDPQRRALLFLWLVYTYLETNSTDTEIGENPYGPGEPPALTKTEKEEDIDTPEEVEFGDNLYNQRVKFLAEDDGDVKKDEKTEKKKQSTTAQPVSTASSTAASKATTSTDETTASGSSSTTAKTTAPSDTPLKLIPKVEKATPAHKTTNTPAKQAAHKNAHHHTVSNSSTPPFTLPLLPKSDIDTEKVRKSLKYLSRIFHKKRDRMGQVKYEHQKIVSDEQIEKERESEDPTVPAPTNNRMRLKNYKGDYVENSDKFFKLFNLLKNDFVEMTKADEEEKVSVDVVYNDTSKDLSLKSFSLNF